MSSKSKLQDVISGMLATKDLKVPKIPKLKTKLRTKKASAKAMFVKRPKATSY